jgi:hypothetical protein
LYLILRYEAVSIVSQVEFGTIYALTGGKRMPPFSPRTADLEQLTGWIGDATIDSINYNRGMAEIVRRQTKAQIAASEAQIEASKAETTAAVAATKAADAAEKNAKYMLLSVIVAAISAIASAAAAYFAYAGLHPSH